MELMLDNNERASLVSTFHACTHSRLTFKCTVLLPRWRIYSCSSVGIAVWATSWTTVKSGHDSGYGQVFFTSKHPHGFWGHPASCAVAASSKATGGVKLTFTSL